MLVFDGDTDNEVNKINMMEAASKTGTGLVTFAARDSEYGGHRIKEGDTLGLVNGKMEYIEKNPVDACYRVTKSLVTKKSTFITIIYGSDMPEAQAEEAFKKIKNKFGSSELEVTLVNGGQPVYYFIVSVE